MKKAIILIILFLSYNIGHSQIIDVDYSNKEQSFVENEEEQENPVEVLGRSFVDIFGNGKIQGTAQLLKLRIGEPKGFYIPFYLFLGASGDGLGNSKQNENTVANLLNPIGGLLNGTFNGRNNIYKSESGITSLKFAYQLSGKLINAQEELTSESKFIGSGYGNLGLFFQTGAWEQGDLDNIGVFWLQAKVTSSFGLSRNSLIDVFGENVDDSFFVGYSFDLGLEINNRINLKAGVYQYFNNQEVDLFSKPFFNFSLDYNLKK
jgi:hypothetical protein